MAHLASYRPTIAPTTDDDATRELARWVEHELETIAQALQELRFLQLSVLHSSVEKPREGMIIFADGSDWNPGSGAGPYAYINSSWVFLAST